MAMSPANNQALLTSILLIAVGGTLLFSIAYYGHFYGEDGTPLTDDSMPPEEVVEAFGARLKDVSLLAPPILAAAAMDTHYAPYVASETLDAWKQNPDSAPGRVTSSPWPERIEVGTTTREENTARVEGVIVEYTSEIAAQGGQAIGYPIVATLERRAEGWKITSFELRTTASPEEVIPNPPTTLTGTYVCLPHKDQSGPQTMECAFGIQTGAVYYALDFSAFTSEQGMTIATGETIRVEGTITLIAQIPLGDSLHNYAIEGVMRISNMSRL
ncbi:hypothetical protein K2Y00_01680 [Patescibacteria group bacterium]|nr:hypothetical protein [Patescibacteria group bacterium]